MPLEETRKTVKQLVLERIHYRERGSFSIFGCAQLKAFDAFPLARSLGRIPENLSTCAGNSAGA